MERFDTTTMKEWLMKLPDFAEMDKVTSLIKEKILSTFVADCKPFA